MCMFRTWRKLQKVLSNWLETTGIEGETEERESFLKELSEVSIYIFFIFLLIHPSIRVFKYSKKKNEQIITVCSWFLKLHYYVEGTGGLHLTCIFLENLCKHKSKMLKSKTSYVYH